VNIEKFAAHAHMIYSPALKKSRVDNGIPFLFLYQMHVICLLICDEDNGKEQH